MPLEVRATAKETNAQKNKSFKLKLYITILMVYFKKVFIIVLG